VVAERLDYPAETALTLGRFVAGCSARAKARRLGISDEQQDAEECRARGAELKPRRRQSACSAVMSPSYRPTMAHCAQKTTAQSHV
jgi:hypothetical protein